MFTLRSMTPPEAAVFAEWERFDRPYPWTERQFLETLESAVAWTLVAEDESDVVGYGVLQIVEAEAYLLNIMVKPDRRLRGVGSQLLRSLLLWAKENKARQLFLDVDPENRPAVNLYTREGFEISARRLRAYPHGEDSLLMKKELA